MSGTPTDLNVLDRGPFALLASRRSVLAAQLAAPGPSVDEIERMLEVAVRVPDHGRLTPWRLQVVGPAAQAELGDLFVEEFGRENPDAKPDRLELERVRPQRSPVLVVVSSRIVPDHDIPAMEQLLSCGNVCLNLLHAATALGYGGQWVTNWPAYNGAVKAALGVALDQHIVGFVHIGTPRTAPAERPRPVLDDVVSFVETLPVA
jgi:nitroreductase